MTLYSVTKEQPILSPFKEYDIEFYLDFETTHTEANAGIWDIGCYVVNNLQGVGASFSRLCQPFGSESQDTLDWIKSKPKVNERYEKACVSKTGQQEALEELAAFLLRVGVTSDRDNEACYSWGVFDFPIAQTAYAYGGDETPWHYGSECDLRSVAKFHGSTIRPDTSLHIAVEDAKALRTAHRELLAQFGSPS